MSTLSYPAVQDCRLTMSILRFILLVLSFSLTASVLGIGLTPSWYDGPCGISKYHDAGGIDPISIKADGTPAEIVNGKSARRGEFPWMVSMYLDIYHWCGGSIINDRWILTAAHCVYNRNTSWMTFVVGDFNTSLTECETEQRFKVERVVIYPFYQINRDNNLMQQHTITDIALVKLRQKIEFNENVQPVCPPAYGETYVNRTAVVSGWGSLGYDDQITNTPLYAVMDVLSHMECHTIYAKELPSNRITLDMLCAIDNTDSQSTPCHGDSGGPLVVKESDGTFTLIGVVSHGISSTINGKKYCNPIHPEVFARTSYFLTWIDFSLDMYRD